ncbi:curli assembly protein CsgF [Arsukibacterium indicum]|uniref:Curli production assembly/transport component CsgF n=1 Tax=Arsukibacterium indicum TaxID=2848612 RepID=A0ABS6MM81_9GAMM|nr:curli assembly protein CsgF [Arsukibacterium indicum]MBV2129912.1 curli assembly protein CsgF [Arsukibacterium indicum]
MKRCAVVLFLLTSALVNATELVYTPINPSFGGNPLNGNFLLQKAQSQNGFKEERPTLSFVDKFQEALERNIINSLTRRIADGELVDGVYNTGEFLVEISTGTDGSVIVNITNLDTGEVTIITIPVIGGGL